MEFLFSGMFETWKFKTNFKILEFLTYKISVFHMGLITTSATAWKYGKEVLL